MYTCTSTVCRRHYWRLCGCFKYRHVIKRWTFWIKQIKTISYDLTTTSMYFHLFLNKLIERRGKNAIRLINNCSTTEMVLSELFRWKCRKFLFLESRLVLSECIKLCITIVIWWSEDELDDLKEKAWMKSSTRQAGRMSQPQTFSCSRFSAANNFRKLRHRRLAISC